LAIAGSAANSPPPVNFEIEGKLEAGLVLPGSAVSSDWTDLEATNRGQGALQCPNNASSCPPAQVEDGPATGGGVLFCDDLEVDPDHTTFTQGDKENHFTNVTNPPPPGGVLVSDTPRHIVTGGVPPQKDGLFEQLFTAVVRRAGTPRRLRLARKPAIPCGKARVTPVGALDRRWSRG
jgi:hypothetical protein